MRPSRKRSLKNPSYPCFKRTTENPAGSCLDTEGKPVYACEDAPTSYGNCAQPLAEFVCERLLSRTEAGGIDPYKATYRQTCLLIEQMLGFSETRPSLRDSFFHTIEGNLRRLITPDRSTLTGHFGLHTENETDFFSEQGRAEYHVNARLLDASLGAFAYRANYGAESELPNEILEATRRDYAEILRDFKSLYAPHRTELATKRTEIVLMLLELYNGKFPYPATDREESSTTAEYNHDYYIIENGVKMARQVKNTDYRMPRSGKLASESYDRGIKVVIYQDVVGFTQRDGEMIVTHIEPSTPQQPSVEDEAYEKYGDWDPDTPRSIRWSTTPPAPEQSLLEEPVEFIQYLDFADRDPLIATLIKHARNEPLADGEALNLKAAAYIVSLFTTQQK